MRNSLFNTQVECKTTNMSEKVCAFYKKHGFNTEIEFTQNGVKIPTPVKYRFYGVNEKGFFNIREEGECVGIKTITFSQLKKLLN